MKKKTVAALLTLVMILSLLPTVALAVRNPFTDVSTADWYYDEVMYVYDEGLMTGTSANLFAPNAATSRAMIWTILARMDGVRTNGNGLWYEKAQAWAIENGISDGSDPNGLITREQFAAMLYRYGARRADASEKLTAFADADDVSDYAYKAMKWAVGTGILTGTNGKLLPQETATRAQVAAMLYRFCTCDLEDEDFGAILAVLSRRNNDCEHTDSEYVDNGDGTHSLVCQDCGEELSTEEHKGEWKSEWECVCGAALDVWDGTAATEEELLAVKSEKVYDETYGMAVERFMISTPNLLAAYANYVNEGKGRNTDVVCLTADMNLGGREWTPIGTKAHPFTGRVFDGQNHTISNLRCNGGATTPTDTDACNQGLFGFTYTNGWIVEIMNLTLENVDIYAKNSAGALIGCLDTAQSVYWLAGYTGIHDIGLTGRVEIEGGCSGGIAGSPVEHWPLQTGFSYITIDVDEGSYLSNVTARELSGDGVGGVLGGVTATAAWDRGSTNITSNLDVIGVAGNVGGIVGIGNQVWYQIECSCNVTIKGVTPSADGKYNYGLAVGGFAPVWHHYDMSAEKRATVVATGELRIELTDGTVVTTNGQTSDAIGGFFW